MTGSTCNVNVSVSDINRGQIRCGLVYADLNTNAGDYPIQKSQRWSGDDTGRHRFPATMKLQTLIRFAASSIFSIYAIRTLPVYWRHENDLQPGIVTAAQIVGEPNVIASLKIK